MIKNRIFFRDSESCRSQRRFGTKVISENFPKNEAKISSVSCETEIVANACIGSYVLNRQGISESQ